jgi:hypothetical protein
MLFFLPSYYVIPPGTIILLNTLFSDTLSLWSTRTFE